MNSEQSKENCPPPMTKDQADRIDFTEPPIRSSFAWADARQGLRHMTFGTCDIEPGNSNAFHAHDSEVELMFVYQGRGKTLIGDEWY